MKVELFAVYDTAAARFVDPFPAPTAEFALRGFSQAVGTEGHQFAMFPEDYSLHHVGTFDPETGMIEALEPRRIAMASSYVVSIDALRNAEPIREVS